MRDSRATFAVATLLLTCCAGSAAPPAQSPGSPAPSSQPVAEAPTPSAPAATGPAPSKPSPPEPDAPPSGAPIDRLMQAHFTDALLIRQAVIAGTPEDAVNPAAVLTHLENLDRLPPGWRGFVERMQRDAGRIKDSTGAAQAAAATADLGVSCGLCHQRNGGPRPSGEAAPAGGSSLETRMNRHVWATERLWEGLYVPSNEAWNAGARALSSEPFPPDVLDGGGVYARSAAGDFAQLVAKAPSKKSADDRAALYAELLVTCGTCHRALKDKR